METIKKYGILIGILLLFLGCNNNQKKYADTKKVLVKYNNGKVFCVGTNSLNTKNGFPLKKVGLWKFYSPNGTLSSFQQYNKNGELINFRNYNIKGVIENSGVYTKNTGTEFYYFEDGKIHIEWITRIEIKGEEETTYGTKKTYYRNSQMAEQSSYIDGERNGTTNIWDENGNLELSVEYKDGFITTDKEQS